jgi:uncharacterized protein
LNKQGRYIVQFGGLKEGIHEFNFLINNKFFEIYKFSDIEEGNIEILVTLNKKPNLLELFFNIAGNIKLICDRCLDDFLFPIRTKAVLYVNFGSDFGEIDDNIIVIPYSENQINISQYIFEFINLNIPIRRVHPEDSKGESMCNKLMLDKIEQYTKKK